MKALLIVNPSASSVTPRGRILIQRALSRDHDISAVETTHRGHATKLAHDAAEEGFDAVVVLGGDGTLNEAANGLAGTATALGALPAGSTNVFARTIGMTNDPIDATAELLDAMSSDRRTRIGLGSANGRYFLFHVGVGFDAAVVETVERRAWLKRYAGHPLFVWATLMTWARYGGVHKPRFAVRFPEGNGLSAPVDGYLTICMNSNPYTYLGNRPFNVAPQLTFENGLSVTTVCSLHVPTFATVVLSALMSGRQLRKHPRTDFRSDVTECHINGFDKFPYQLDGDYVGDVDSLTLRHNPQVLDVFMPL